MIENKVWGVVQHVFDGPVSVSLLRVNAGTYCSTHRHEKRYNHFHVISGKLLIRLYDERLQSVDKIILKRHERISIPPGTYHRFEVLGDGQIVETYWTKDGSPATLDDIERVHEGGVF